MFARRVLGAIVLTGVLFATQGYSQCYNDTTCTGNVIPATDRKDCCVRTEDGLSFSDGGTCRGCIVHGFPRTVYNVVESTGIGADSREGRLDTVFQLNVKGNGDPSLIFGIITAEGDGATVEDDFEGLSPPISVDIDLNSDPVEIRLIMENDDISLEYNESIILRFTTPDDPTLFDDVEALGQYIRDTARVNIIDNDQLQINFAQADYEFVEGSTERPRILLRFRTVQNPFTITIRPVDIDYIERKILSSFIINFMDPNLEARAVAGVDFSSVAMTFTVPPNVDEFVIPNFFTVVDDDINEIDQSFALVAELGPDVPDDFACFQIRDGDTECFGTGRLGATEIKIIDNDVMVIGFRQRYVTVKESDAAPGEDQFSIKINVSSNITSEQRYLVQFRVLQSTPPGSELASVGPLLSSNIRDFDVIFGNEESNIIREIRRLFAGNRQLSAGVSAAITNDFLSEEFECFTIRIGATDDEGVRNVFNCTSDSDSGNDFFCQMTICIEDDDEPFVVGFVETAYTVNECVGVVSVCVNLTQPVTDILDEFVIVRVTDYPSVNLTCSSTLATPDSPTLGMTNRSDYVQQTRRFNAIDDTRIEELMRTVCYNQPIYEDGRLEEIEYFGLTLSVRQASAATDIQPMYNLATICITDNDTAVVGLEETSYTVSEDVGFVNVCAIVYSPSIDCPIEFPFSVGLSTRDGLATSSMDYGALMSTILLFDTCQTKQCALIGIEDDENIEDVENFFVTLERTPGLNDRITLDPIDGEIQISDNEAVVGLERTLYQVSEGVGYVLVCAVVFSPDENTDCPIGFAFDVELSTTDGTAVQIMDYDSLDMTLQFAECERMSCVNITINEDETLENIESFNVTLERNGLDSNITLNPTRAEIEIRDDDGPGVVGLEETFYQTTEGVGMVEVCAVVYSPNGNLACPIDFAFSVELQTRDDDAVSTMDYGSITTTLPFGRCDTRSCVNVSITDDEVLENPESFSVSLQRNGLDSRITLEPTEAEIEIIDNDDAVIGLERTLYSIREGSAPAVQVCIVVYEPTGICPIAFPFSVMFSTSDGTAVVDNDYLDADRTQDFEACDTKRCIMVQIVDDSTEEPDEHLSISLGDPSDSRIIASPKEGLINIIDRDTSTQIVFVNDTVTGDPLMTVPVATLPDTSTLCYEVHGEADKFFNLISDNCVSVNAHYAKAGINNPNITLNVIDAVGIRAVSSIGSCVNIRVGLEGCTASIDGVDLSGMYRENGIVVRKYSSRVRITVPNCEDTDLVMWVFCTRGGTEDPYTWEYFSFNFLRFVVMRGLNLREESHGLLGQFWNIEIEVEEHAEPFNRALRSDDFTVTVHPNDPSRKRSFVALESSVTWEFEKKPCLYVGNSQAGPLGEDVAPNESVIEGSYKDYMVDSMFSPNFIFAHFDQDNCMAQ
jgi:hypothetical protein